LVILSLSLLLSGLVALTLGADRFVLAAARLSRAWGLSPVLIGALVVGLGTSAPELLVTIFSAARGEVDIALGNVVGSNVANVTLVLGATALVAPISSRVRTIRREGFVMSAGLVLLTVFLWDLGIVAWEGLVLVGSMLLASLLLVWWARGDARAGRLPYGRDNAWSGSVGRESLLGLGTLILTLVGADLLVRGASRLATELGISTAFVGLVIVAVGTSLPELATALAAARRSEPDLVLGNVLGSNLFNSLAVAGIAGLIGPGEIDAAFRNALGFMIFSGLLAGGFALTYRRIERWEGAVLLAVFLGFVAVAA
jgi:cation:H+ antiporter